jgi:hypothetical protein
MKNKMALKKNRPVLVPFTVVAVSTLFILVACASAERDTPQSTPEIKTDVPSEQDVQQNTLVEKTAAPALDAWSELLQRTPFPYTTPLPPADSSALDGTFVKFDPRQDERIPCRRCPPYPPEGGLWKLNFSGGIFRVYHERTGWRTLGSFTVSGDRVQFYNDPHCYDVVGGYSWKLEQGQLVLQAIEDDCGGDLRVKHFTSMPWTSCQPTSTEAAVTDHWPVPDGCRNDTGSD